MNEIYSQTEGAKEWRVYEPGSAEMSYPVRDLGMKQRGKNGDVLSRDDVGALLLKTTLRLGSILYLPRGFPHATQLPKIRDLASQLEVCPDGGSYSYHEAEEEAASRACRLAEQHQGIMHSKPLSNYSTSITLSLLTEGIGLTGDKVLKCLWRNRQGGDDRTQQLVCA